MSTWLSAVLGGCSASCALKLAQKRAWPRQFTAKRRWPSRSRHQAPLGRSKPSLGRNRLGGRRQNTLRRARRGATVVVLVKGKTLARGAQGAAPHMSGRLGRALCGLLGAQARQWHAGGRASSRRGSVPLGRALKSAHRNPNTFVPPAPPRLPARDPPTRPAAPPAPFGYPRRATRVSPAGVSLAQRWRQAPRNTQQARKL